LTSATGRAGQRLALLGADDIVRFAYREHHEDEAERF
jgi:hypothetical protein